MNNNPTPKQIVSPCIGNCKLIDNACVGCKRTLIQITNWRTMSSQQRDQIISELNEKRSLAPLQTSAP
ncbi:DUF1289 domain-containing protein [Corallincola spongiicola]|uniref:DUF1289 domain-containing protein n=1 Tax=Corallincola spongiicola TaxID=2520508 RepID=A0ABY1WTJ7_9GAMM|nr:DUF1289 domain-containing protein [Corallincola spongiicola]TAA48063.1 DUF1289 domain-containing protein [Corallincola spongiicola]